MKDNGIITIIEILDNILVTLASLVICIFVGLSGVLGIYLLLFYIYSTCNV